MLYQLSYFRISLDKTVVSSFSGGKDNGSNFTQASFFEKKFKKSFNPPVTY
ncbi:MAG: hypothetical protein WCR52_09055 [Bacteroidota bacterium]